MEKRLGKLSNVRFGRCGYQDSCLGLSVTLGEGELWEFSDNKSFWDYNSVNCSDIATWTEEDRSKSFVSIMQFISNLLKEAKVSSIQELNGTPIEATFNGNILKGWRVLTEVL